MAKGYSHQQHLADVMRDAQRISEESRESTRRHIEHMQAWVDRTEAYAELRDGTGRVIERRWQSDLARTMRERQAKTHEARRRNEANLVPGMRVPEWITVGPVGARCGRSISSLHDSSPSGGAVLGAGHCTRPPGHDGRHVAVTRAAGTIIGVGDRLDEKPTPKKVVPRTPADAQLDNQFDTPGNLAREMRRLKEALGDKPDTPPTPKLPSPVVGQPCPDHIALSQGADRCPHAGADLDDLLCSRTADHDGEHVATAGDAVGAEVLAFCE